MQVCDLEPEGSAPWELLRKYGGKFGLFEKIKMRGVGSPKIIYTSGLSELDQFVEAIAGSDIPYVNFEYLKNGILARINKTQYLKGVLISYDEIDFIVLSNVFKYLRKKENSLVTSKQKIDYGRGKLEIKINSGEVLVFQVTVQSNDGIEKFFKKNKSLQNKFESTIL